MNSRVMTIFRLTRQKKTFFLLHSVYGQVLIFLVTVLIFCGCFTFFLYAWPFFFFLGRKLFFREVLPFSLPAIHPFFEANTDFHSSCITFFGSHCPLFRNFFSRSHSIKRKNYLLGFTYFLHSFFVSYDMMLTSYTFNELGHEVNSHSDHSEFFSIFPLFPRSHIQEDDEFHLTLCKIFGFSFISIWKKISIFF